MARWRYGMNELEDDLLNFDESDLQPNEEEYNDEADN